MLAFKAVRAAYRTWRASVIRQTGSPGSSYWLDASAATQLALKKRTHAKAGLHENPGPPLRRVLAGRTASGIQP